ncbi:hypothetical protein FIBSPDRAFT_877678 [Athelia psychrophila]|uniref:Uncharacterized protein n=1 Tax=Athelia psychrophila TaxID=1759441 RepID=A0A167VSC7_9AGAM|nr:hypothetical protein FIBSPDRAFT_877678 [Fibularhizoctonia sp. CBS 109695]
MARLCFEHSEKYGFVKWMIVLDNATLASAPFFRQNLPKQNGNDLASRPLHTCFSPQSQSAARSSGL